MPSSLKNGSGSMHASGGRTPRLSILPFTSQSAVIDGGTAVSLADDMPVFLSFQVQTNMVHLAGSPSFLPLTSVRR